VHEATCMCGSALGVEGQCFLEGGQCMWTEPSMAARVTS
jgi:hypothetical protein